MGKYLIRSGNGLFCVVAALVLAAALGAGCRGDREGSGAADPDPSGNGTGNGEDTTGPPQVPGTSPGTDDPDTGDIPDAPPPP